MKAAAFSPPNVLSNLCRWPKIYSLFTPSGSNCLNFKLPVESNTQSQPLQDILL
jgi:hypothetical protein